MKKAITIIGFALYALLYCFAIEAAVPVYDSSSSDSKELNIEKYSFVSSPSANLTAGTFHFRSTNKNSSFVSFASSNLYEEGIATIKHTEQLFASKFAQYSSLVINFFD